MNLNAHHNPAFTLCVSACSFLVCGDYFSYFLSFKYTRKRTNTTMLARAARRKLRRNAYTSPDLRLSAQLVLPWLCPAQMRWAASVGTLTHDAARRQRQLPAHSPRSDTRSLATTADTQATQFTPYPPPQVLRGGPNGFMHSWTPTAPSPDLAKLAPWDTSKPLVIHDSLSAAVPTTPTRMGIGGDPVELHQNLHACVRVGRMDRAAAIVQRLTDLYSPSAPDVIHAHNVFLKAKLEIAHLHEKFDHLHVELLQRLNNIERHSKRPPGP